MQSTPTSFVGKLGDIVLEALTVEALFTRQCDCYREESFVPDGCACIAVTSAFAEIGK